MVDLFAAGLPRHSRAAKVLVPQVDSAFTDHAHPRESRVVAEDVSSAARAGSKLI